MFLIQYFVLRAEFFLNTAPYINPWGTKITPSCNVPNLNHSCTPFELLAKICQKVK